MISRRPELGGLLGRASVRIFSGMEVQEDMGRNPDQRQRLRPDSELRIALCKAVLLQHLQRLTEWQEQYRWLAPHSARP